jgi:hypothetical protein
MNDNASLSQANAKSPVSERSGVGRRAWIISLVEGEIPRRRQK